MYIMCCCSSAVVHGYSLGLLTKRPQVRTLCSCMKHRANLFTLHCLSSPSCLNDYLAVDSSGYLCRNFLCTLIAARLGASQRSSLPRNSDEWILCYLTYFILKLVQTSCSQLLIISSNQSVSIKKMTGLRLICCYVTVIGNNLNFVGTKNMALCEVGKNGCCCRLSPL